MSQLVSEVCHCSQCHADTNHVVVLVRKESPFKDRPNSKLKEFWHGAIKGWFLGAFVAAMDDFSRHRVCEACGHKEIED
ncbi:hypothetical protein O1C89_002333 [Vibrio cholerae]|nr:hypothetical protein [Vibrio cholerae]